MGEESDGGKPPPLLTDNDDNKKLNTNKQYQFENIKYLHYFKDPFIVIVEKNDQENPPFFHDMKVGKFFGLSNTQVHRIRRKNKNQIEINFKTYELANRFLENPFLIRNNIKAFIPLQNVLKFGVIRDVHTSITEEEIVKNLSSEEKVLRVRRFNRIIRSDNGETSRVPSGSVQVVFHSQRLPDNVSLYLAPRKVTPYVTKPRFCEKCLRYGHMKDRCRGRERCINCGDNQHTSQNCSEMTKCVHCKLNHKANDKTCPEKQRQEKIKELMAVRPISYKEASDIFPTQTSNKFSLLDFPQIEETSHQYNPYIFRNPRAKINKPRNSGIEKRRRTEEGTEPPIFSEICAGTSKPRAPTNIENPHKSTPDSKYINMLNALIQKIRNLEKEEDTINIIGQTFYNFVQENKEAINNISGLNETENNSMCTE